MADSVIRSPDGPILIGIAVPEIRTTRATGTAGRRLAETKTPPAVAPMELKFDVSPS